MDKGLQNQDNQIFLKQFMVQGCKTEHRVQKSETISASVSSSIPFSALRISIRSWASKAMRLLF